MTKRAKGFWIGLCLLLISIAPLALALFPAPDNGSSKVDRPIPRVRVEAFEAREGPIRQWILSEGIVRTVRREFLRFEVPGRVIELAPAADGRLLRNGAEVEGPVVDGGKGQLLAKLDDREYAIAVKQSEAEWRAVKQVVAASKAEAAQTRSELAYRQKEFGRIRKLQKKKVIAANAFDEVKRALNLAHASVDAALARIEVAVAQEEAAQARLDQAHLNFERTSLYAPFDGVVARMNLTVGDYIDPVAIDRSSEAARLRTSPIVLIDPSVYEVMLDIPLLEGRQVREGQEAYIRLGAVDIKSIVTDEIPAVVHSVSPVLSPEWRMVRVRIRTRPDTGSIRDGENLQVRIKVRERTRAVIISRRALLYQGGRTFCFVVDPSGGIARRREVHLGIEEEDRVEVVRGVSAGERVVTQGRQRLGDGMPISLLSVAGGIDHE